MSELPGMWEEADFTGGRQEAEEVAAELGSVDLEDDVEANAPVAPEVVQTPVTIRNPATGRTWEGIATKWSAGSPFVVTDTESRWFPATWVLGRDA
jgi:hypothetical protein